MAESRRSARPVLGGATTRAELQAIARREARKSRGKRYFLLQERVLPVGVPLGAVVGAAAWYQDRRRGRRGWPAALGAAAATVALSYLAGMIEWEMLEREHRRAHGFDD